MGNIYGYVRVSTREQHEDRQILALQEFGVSERDIYTDKLSGKDFERPKYKSLRRKLKKGDVLVVKSIDRLGRSYTDIQEEWRFITKDKEADIVVLDMPLLDTRRKEKDLTGTFISDLVLQILCYVAQVERENIRRRQAEGIAAAKAKGVRFGRERMEIPKEFAPICAQYKARRVTAREAAKELGVAHSTFLKWVRFETDNCKELIEKR